MVSKPTFSRASDKLDAKMADNNGILKIISVENDAQYNSICQILVTGSKWKVSTFVNQSSIVAICRFIENMIDCIVLIVT